MYMFWFQQVPVWSLCQRLIGFLPGVLKLIPPWELENAVPRTIWWHQKLFKILEFKIFWEKLLQISRNENRRELNMYVPVCVCAHITFFIIPKIRGRTWALSSECKTDQVHFTDWCSSYKSQNSSAQISNAII